MKRSILTMTAVVASACGGAAVAQQYVGDIVCSGCHANMPYQGFFDAYMASGHPWKLFQTGGAVPAADAYPHTDLPPLPMVNGAPLQWSDVEYIIGNYFWKARFVDREGFIWTGSETDSTQWNLATAEFVPYHPGETRPYNCGRCHTTGYDAEGNQNDLPGLIGTWTEEGVRCEACHGPGSLHIANPVNVPPPGGKACSDCHYRDSSFRMPWSGGFMRHHQQSEDFAHSPHDGIDLDPGEGVDEFRCETCHNPHRSTVYDDGGLITECSDCHAGTQDNNYYQIGAMGDIDCVDCHMPYMGKSAVAFNQFLGDIKGHIFRIMTEPVAAVDNVYDDGTGNLFWKQDAEGQSAVTLDYACLGCHEEVGVPLTLQQAADLADGIHSGPFSTFATALHNTRAGKNWWYGTENGGFETFTGIPIEELGCVECHGPMDANGNENTEDYEPSCSDCHATETDWGLSKAQCYSCHGRQKTEAITLGYTDEHRAFGLPCWSCHTLGDMHGDGTPYDSMLEPGAIDVECTDCHDAEPPNHDLFDPHDGKLHCASCHTQSVVSCYNCHFESQVDSHVKRALRPIDGFVMLVNRDKDGTVYPATFQSLTYQGDSFVALAPYYAHTITDEGRQCADCHVNFGGEIPSILEYNATGEIDFAEWDDDTKTLSWLRGIVPITEDYETTLHMDFLTYTGDTANPPGPDFENWTSIGEDTPDGWQMLFATPLSFEQMAKMGFDVDLPTGACCLEDGSCVEITSPACDLQDGVYEGDGVLCDDVECAEPCPADVDGNGSVDVDDLIAVILAWGTDDEAADVDDNGTVDVDDLVAVILAWGECP